LKFFYWPPCDNLPPFRGKGASFAGLRDIIALLNSIFTGVILGGILYLFWSHLLLGVSIGTGVVSFIIVWCLHQIYENSSLNRAEELASKRDVKFPIEGLDISYSE